MAANSANDSNESEVTINTTATDISDKSAEHIALEVGSIVVSGVPLSGDAERVFELRPADPEDYHVTYVVPMYVEDGDVVIGELSRVVV